jgi:hypothetical protein
MRADDTLGMLVLMRILDFVRLGTERAYGSCMKLKKVEKSAR